MLATSDYVKLDIWDMGSQNRDGFTCIIVLIYYIYFGP